MYANFTQYLESRLCQTYERIHRGKSTVTMHN